MSFQIAGGVVGALLEALLIPGLHLGKNPYRAPGCFYPGHVNGLQCALLLCPPAVRPSAPLRWV